MVRTNNKIKWFCKYSFVYPLFVVASVLTIITQGHVLEFTVEPSDTVVDVDQSAVLDCVVKASHHQSSVLIQWLDQDGSKLNYIGDNFRSQLMNGSLYINSVKPEQNLVGTYRCMATLPNVGSIISRTATLSIASLTGFYDEPRDVTVFIGQKAHFACHAIANPPPRIRWLKDERPLQIDELRMTILPSGALEIDEVIESDQGSYRCNASGLNSYKLSNKANLIINSDQEQAARAAAPVFIAKPHDDVVIEGQNISLDCAANGYPNPSITWLKDGVDIDMNFLDSRFSLVGSTKSLRITNIQEQDAGIYQCRAENREDSSDASAKIDVQVPPRFLKKPQDKIEAPNKDTELECNVYGKPEPKVQWYKNGELVVTNDYYKIVNGHNLKIMGLLASDSGLFQCFATNKAGNIQASASLRVTQVVTKPMVRSKKVNKPDKNNKQHSKSLFLSLNADSADSDSLGLAAYGHLQSKITDSPNSYYNPHNAFSALKSSDNRDSMKSSNSEKINNLGNTQSAFVPSFRNPTFPVGTQKNINGLPGPPRDLKAPVVKARFIILSWKPPLKNGENILTYSVYYKQEGSQRERYQNATKAKLEEMSITNLVPGRVYHFRVVAINSLGAGEFSEVLTITTQPEEHVATAPQEFEAYATSSRSIHISWKPPEDPNGFISRYTIYYMETNTLVEHSVETKDLEYDLTGLTPYTEYNLWMVAVNNNGPGATTEEKLVRTFGDIPSEPPSNVTAEATSPTSVILKWEPPPVESQNGIITGYKVKYRKQGRKGVTLTTAANARHLPIKDLEPVADYQFKLWAMNVNGSSPSTEWINVNVLENGIDESRVPDKPASLQVRPASDKLYLMWSPPANQNIRIRHYIIGWGKGVPDIYSKELDENIRFYLIEKLDPNSEYVISLRASNEVGAGPPIYTTTRTADEPPPEPDKILMPPVGLKAIVLSPTSVVLYWTDPTLKNSQYIRDNRHYRVQWTVEKSGRSKFINVTDLNVMIQDLKPNTNYEFAVKLVKGRRESPWSMVVQNKTWELPPSVAPQNLDVHLKEGNDQLVELTWQPPKLTTGRVTGYVILYTDNKTKDDAEWQVLAIKGDNHSSVIYDLSPFTLYYFKVQARNSRGYGPYSDIVTFRTGQKVAQNPSFVEQYELKGIFSGNLLLYLIIGGCLVALITIVAVTSILCCRKKDVTSSLERSKKGYQKGTQNIKPPDLWIHHDQMELKAMEKRHGTNDGASSSGALTLPRSGTSEYDNHDNAQTNSLDKRAYISNYGGDENTRLKRPVKSKPIINLPVDSKPPREPIATPINSAVSQSSSDSTPSNRPQYPRTQYTVGPRAHVSLDPNCGNESVYNSHPAHGNYDSSSNSTYISNPQPGTGSVGGGYAPGLGIINDNQSGAKRVTAQGHPLKSFTVPAPPPISAPSTPQTKHIVTVRPNTSPYKKPPTSSSTPLGTPPSRISASNPPPHTAEEVQRLQPSHSTEELNQEMANLEGLMLTLNAITANEFEC